MAGLAAVIAAAAGAVQAQGRTVGLNVAEALAIVALLGWRSVIIPYSDCRRVEEAYSQWYGDAGSCWTRVLSMNQIQSSDTSHMVHTRLLAWDWKYQHEPQCTR